MKDNANNCFAKAKQVARSETLRCTAPKPLPTHLGGTVIYSNPDVAPEHKLPHASPVAVRRHCSQAGVFAAI